MPGSEPEPLRYGMTLPNGQKLRYGMPGARWGGTVAEVMQALQQQQAHTMLALATTLTPSAALTTALGQIQEIIDSVMAPALARRTRAEIASAPQPPAPPTP